MSFSKLALRCAIGLAVLTTVSGCGATAAIEPSPTSTATEAVPEPNPSLTRDPADADAVLFIRVTATAANGAQLDIETQIHRSSAFDYLGTEQLNKILIEDCGALFTEGIFAADAWSFTRGNTTAIPTPGNSTPWPAEAAITALPLAQFAYLGGRGMFQNTPPAGILACQQDKFFTSEGRGATVIGIPNDTIDQQTFNNKWALHRWGISAPAGVTLSNCSFELTPLGAQYGGGVNWIESADAANCSTGPASETATF